MMDKSIKNNLLVAVLSIILTTVFITALGIVNKYEHIGVNLLANLYIVGMIIIIHGCILTYLFEVLDLNNK